MISSVKDKAKKIYISNATKNAKWLKNELLQEARKIQGAAMQHITYKHWLPLIIGKIL